MDAFYLINKPLGITSFDVIRILKKKLQIKRIGHAGTLDPLATGLLLIATGNYTKLLSFCIIKEKNYSFDIMLNGKSDSYDLGTEVIFLSAEKQKFFKEHMRKQDIEDLILKKYSGNIDQIPPKYSALKIAGKRALERTLAGEDFEIKKRSVYISQFIVKNFNYPTLSCEAEVSSGTYIRSLAYDIGQDLGTGGYISRLSRTKLSQMYLEEAQDLENFDQENSYDENKVFGDAFIISLQDDVVKKLALGQKVCGDFPFIENTPLFVKEAHKIVAVCSYEQGWLIPKRKI